MAKKLTKAETKRLYAAILSKTQKLYFDQSINFGIRDLDTIEKIIHRYQKKL